MDEELKFISLAEAAKITNYSQDYISLLCRQKKMKAQKLGRNWVTTKDWVYSYVNNSNGSGATIVPVKVNKSNDQKISSAKEIWVYSYVNNSNGSGATIVPVKVNKSNDQKISSAKEICDKKNEREEFVNEMEVFSFRKNVLAASLFCFSSLLILFNFFGFFSYISDTASPEVYSKNIYYEVVGSVAGVSTERFSEDNSDLDNDVFPTILEIDDSVIEEDQKEELVRKIQEGFTKEIGVDFYEGFAVIYYLDNPQNRFLYIER